MYWKALPDRIWWFGLFLIAILAAALLVFLGWRVKYSVTDQLLKQQQTLTRAEASNIRSFFQTFGNSVAVIAQSDSMKSRDSTTQDDLDTFVGQWSDTGLVAGVLLADARGVVQFNSNVLGTHDVGASLADRDYFVWAKTQPGEGKYFVGTAVISRVGGTKGQVIVPVASPVFQNGVFVGIVATSAKLQPLTQRYLELMKISGATDVYLVGAKGDLLFDSAAPDKVGTNIFGAQGGAFLGNQTLSDRLKDALDNAKEGGLQATYLDPKTGKTESHLIAYSPIPVGNRNWLLVMASPAQQVTEATVPVYIRQIGIFLLFSLSILLYAIVIARENQKKTGLDVKDSQKKAEPKS